MNVYLFVRLNVCSFVHLFKQTFMYLCIYGVAQMHKITNTQSYKTTITQIHKCTINHSICRLHQSQCARWFCGVVRYVEATRSIPFENLPV